MNDLIDEILAEMPDPIPVPQERQQFIVLDDRVPNPVRLPADESWVKILSRTNSLLITCSLRADGWSVTGQ